MKNSYFFLIRILTYTHFEFLSSDKIIFSAGAKYKYLGYLEGLAK